MFVLGDDHIMVDYDVDIQLAENDEISENDYNEYIAETFEEKRKLLEKTKIVKQTWSITEIYQKINSNILNLDPDYQRNEIWGSDKKTAFIESLYMGIIIPPVYVVEILGEDILDSTTYEVVDGKQRLSTIFNFIRNDIELREKSLEYFGDWFSKKRFTAIRDEHTELTNEMLSSVLDIYVITANSPEFTKYDIFSRLNKGSDKLKVNEIRKAIYRSKVLQIIDNYVKEKLENDPEYKERFSVNDIKRYEDYGRFYRSIAFYLRTDIENAEIKGYNSRPREMINDVLYKIQKREITIDQETVLNILDNTLLLMKKFEENIDHFVDSCIYYAVKEPKKLVERIEAIKADKEINLTFTKSGTTTSNVNKRIARVINIMKE